MNITTETYFSISTLDRPGALAEITAILLEAELDMSGIWGFGTGGGNAQIMAVPHDIDAFKAIANKAGWKIEEGHCFHLEGEDRAGALVDLLNKIKEEGLNLTAVDAIGVSGQFGCYIWPHEEDVVAISELLGLRTPLI